MVIRVSETKFRTNWHRGVFPSVWRKLEKNNRWVKMAVLLPWDHIEDVYLQSVDEEAGRPAMSARIAYGAIFIKENESITDEGTVTAIQENPYMQYFLGLKEFQPKPLLDAFMMVHFRKRFPVVEVAKINEYIFFHPVRVPVVLADDLRLKRTVPVARDFDLHLAQLGLDGLFLGLV